MPGGLICGAHDVPRYNRWLGSVYTPSSCGSGRNIQRLRLSRRDVANNSCQLSGRLDLVGLEPLPVLGITPILNTRSTFQIRLLFVN